MSTKGNLPFDNDFVARIDNERYFVMTATKAEGVGGRTWQYEQDTAQDVAPSKLSLPLMSFHEGCGFSYAGVEYVYDYAGHPVTTGAGDGWDMSVLGRVVTWARHGAGEAATTLSGAPAAPGWLKQVGNYLYMARGRYLSKYSIDTTAGNTWTRPISDFDLGSGNHVPGRIARWNSKLYVPRAADSTGVLQRAYEVTVASGTTADTRTLLPSDKTARGFRRYKNLIARFVANGMATCATTPTTATNWSDDGGVGLYEAPDPGVNITDLVQWGLYVFAPTEDGVWSYTSDDFQTRNEIPAIADSIVPRNNAPAETLNDQILFANDGGAIRWVPGEKWKYVGPNQEGGWEGGLARGWGKVVGIIPNGPATFVVYRDEVNQCGSIVGLYPGKGGRDPIPQMHFQTANGYFGNGCIVTASTGERYLAVIRSNTAGTIASPWIWRLPLGLDGANDSRVPKFVSDTAWRTPRYWAPARNIKKGWRELEFWLTLVASSGALSSTPGLQVWAIVDDGTPFQLNDSSGAPVTIKASGPTRVFLPDDTSGFGHYLQFEFRVPALGVGEHTVSVDIRDLVLRGNFYPRTEQLINATLVLSQGEFEGIGSMARSANQQRADLAALVGDRSQPIPFRDPWGDTGFCTVEKASFKEVQFQGSTESAFIAQVALRVVEYA